MIRILKNIAIFIISGIMMAACSGNKDEDNPRSGLPEKEAAGEYQGTYSRVTKGLDDTVTAPGTVTITPASSPNTAYITFFCEDLGVDVTRIFNFTFANDGYAFSNHLSDETNTKTSAIVGKIDSNKKIITRFTLQQRDGRKTVQFDYEFNGQ